MGGNGELRMVLTTEEEPLLTASERDEYGLSYYLRANWNDIFAEPESYQSIDFIWGISRSAFECSRNCCYILLTLLTAPCVGFCQGLCFAYQACCHIWCIAPCLKQYQIQFIVIRRLIRMCLYTFCAPCCETCGMYLSKIVIRHQSLESDSVVFDDENPLAIVVHGKKSKEPTMEEITGALSKTAASPQAVPPQAQIVQQPQAQQFQNQQQFYHQQQLQQQQQQDPYKLPRGHSRVDY